MSKMRDSMMSILEPEQELAAALNRADLVTKLAGLFNQATVDAASEKTEGSAAIAQLSERELQFHLDRTEMKALLQEVGLWETFDSDADGKLSMDKLLFHMDADGDGQVSLLECLRTVFGMENGASAEQIHRFSEHWV